MNAKQIEVQLIEATLVAERFGHSRNAYNPETCELCQSLITLRRELPRHRQLAVNIEVRRRNYNAR